VIGECQGEIDTLLKAVAFSFTKGDKDSGSIISINKYQSKNNKIDMRNVSNF
jgi:hypothetical protein